MKRSTAYLFGFGLLNFVLFMGVFTLLQREGFHKHTLGRVAQNYERTGDWNNYEIKRTAKPFNALRNDDLVTWDAAIYKCISERSYAKEGACYGTVRGAFFPLFPLLWKATGLTPIGISIVNYILFMASVALLLMYLFRSSMTNTLLLYLVLITLPSVVIFWIPYSESLFMATFTLAAFGVIQRRYWVYGIGAFAMSMVRPASVFVLLALLFIELLVLLFHKDGPAFVKRVVLRSAPWLMGYAGTMAIQRYSSGSWTTMVDAQAAWSGGVQVISGISDWSVEGFGLSVFSIFAVCIPLLLTGTYALVRWSSPAVKRVLEKLEHTGTEYVAVVCAAYLVGIFVFTLLTSGGNLHSFFRFTLATPFFYVLVLVFMDHLRTHPIKHALTGYAIGAVLLCWFLLEVEFGGSRTDFSFFGMYLSMATGLFLVLFHKFALPIRIALTCVLVLLNTVWNAYLFNAFLCNGWLFT